MTALTSDQFRPVRGALHVHTALDGDGSGAVADVHAAAVAADLDFLIITDHHGAYAAADGWHGRQEGEALLTVVGMELTTGEDHHLLALGIHLKIGAKRLGSAQALELLDQLGATTFIAHPQGCRVFSFQRLKRVWRDYAHHLCTGLEVWAYMHDWIEGLTPWNVPERCRHPAQYITGPDADVLAAWDEQATRRAVAGVGALDTHARRLPFGLEHLLPWAKGGVLPYEQSFRAFSHHTLTPKEWGTSHVRDATDLVASLASGRNWISHEELSPAGAFVFEMTEDGATFPVGTETAWRAGQRLLVRSPEKADLRIWRRGAVVAEAAEADALEYEAVEPGEYRVTAHLGECYWVLTNHIYLRELGHPALSRRE